LIPRLKPYLNREELSTLFRHQSDAVVNFERAFAQAFHAEHAIAFPYGRSALWALFKALEIEDAEIITPAYTCVVVAHAIVLSGNVPRFVDIKLDDYNMDLDQFETSINERTRAVVATHLFGYPLDVDTVKQIVQNAQKRFGHKIWIIQDCAHAFGAEWNGGLVCDEEDIALFGLNISKVMTSIFGGMLSTSNDALATQVRSWRDHNYSQPSSLKKIMRSIYLLGTYIGFNETVYDFVYWLQEKTPILNRLTKAYHLDEKIHFPPDYLDQMLDIEAQVGLIQLMKYPKIVQKRRQNAQYYQDHLQNVKDLILPPIVDGATYSHYVIRGPDRERTMRALASKGVQLGQLIEYSVPHMEAYRKYTGDQDFPNSFLSSQTTLNLPIHAELNASQLSQVKDSLISVLNV
jgi:dTDP-4-amino-4,6-dideoxygalactose transaminase